MIEFHEQASAEVRKAQQWYAERSRRASLRFRLEVGKALDRIEESPQRFPKLLADYRYARVFGFPYIIVFRRRDDGAEFVVAIAHTSRRSGYWMTRDRM